MSVPIAPFRAVPLLFMEPPPDSEFYEFLQEAHRLVERHPRILAAIDADLDLHGLAKKALRVEDAQWHDARNLDLPTMGWRPGPIAPESLHLKKGRPRAPAYVVYMFMVGRGYFGGYRTSEAKTLMQESLTLQVMLANQGIELPAPKTLNDLANAVRNSTREQILDAQLCEVLQEGWDDFTTSLMDSTAVKANTRWPTESCLMVDLVERMSRLGGKLDRLGLPNFACPQEAKLLGALSELHREISMGAEGPRKGRARAQRRMYRAMLKKARRAGTLLLPEIERARQALATLDSEPSRRVRAERVVSRLGTDIVNLHRVIASCEARIVRDEKVAAKDKVLSISDPDAAMIVKGDREPKVGYKPQLARSGNGFITALIVPVGNAADSSQLVPLFDQVEARTRVVPDIVSVDDGYASDEGRTALQDRGVRVVSISGSKGKRLTPADEWNSEEYATARDDRSAVESLMFIIKHGFDFGDVVRRGVDCVRAELLEKALAYNFCRVAMLRRAVRDQADVTLDPAAQDEAIAA